MKLAAGLIMLATYAPYLVWGDTATALSSAAAAASTTDATRAIIDHHIYCNCQPIYEPVCGSNGITYSNECVLRCVSQDHMMTGRAPVRQLYPGVCRSVQCNCNSDAQPVCGTNNQTYINDCYRLCHNSRRTQVNLPPVGVAYQGICKKSYCRCPNSVVPVCGTDGKTYRNICVLQCYSRHNKAQGLPAIIIKSPHACKNESCSCPLIENQRCASDDNTYYNECVLNCQNRRLNQLGLDPLTVQYPGECINCICTASIDPVCGSDGKTYSNLCVMQCENKKRNRLGLPLLSVHWRGYCNCSCSKDWKPICASNRKTWGTSCLLHCENKRRSLKSLPPLTVLYEGECKPCYCDYRLNLYSPVCGSNRQTYRNICFFNCRSDCNVATGLPPIRKVVDKEC